MKMYKGVLQWLALSFFYHECRAVDLIYHVEEEKSPDSYVGNIASDSKLLESIPSEEHNLVRFHQLHQRQTGNDNLFTVSKTGELYTAQKLDAELLCTSNTECFRIIKISVRRAQTFMKILKIKVVIEDVNDNSPEFLRKSVKLDFSEGDAMGLTKSIPNAIDKDVGDLNSKIIYELQRKINDPFKLSVTKRMTGSSKLGLILTERLDRERKASYTLQVIARDGGNPMRQGILRIQVSVTDLNDNSPLFTQNTFNISIKNTHHRNSPILILSAKDLDFGNNGKISYHFSPETSTAATQHFYLNAETGGIFVVKNFTSRQTQTYKLYVEAKDGGSSPLTSIAMILVNVVDQQNHPPEIDINFVTELTKNTASISEGIKVGSFIAYVNVIDNDIGLNGEVECSLHHDKFLLLDLGSKEYKITLKKPVDREKQDRYDITISCEDKGSPPLQTQRQFSIEVMDVNDVQPQFTRETFKFLTYENEKPNFPVGFIDATDPDIGLGGTLVYSLFSNTGNNLPFIIADYGFISTNRPLDREKQEAFRFKVFVRDSGVPSLNNTANVIVEVLDENDNAPYFTFPSVNPFSLDVHYYPQSKNDITVLKASDRDSRENAFLKYEILDGNTKQLFKVNPYTGVMSFSRTVYQNDAGSYKLLLAVKDNGTPVLSSTTTLSLTLTVSNKTSTKLNSAHLPSDNTVDATMLIIIVVAAVIVSIVVVVSVTLCIVRCNNGQSNQARPGVSTAIPCNREKSHYTTQTKKTIPAPRHSVEMRNRNILLMESNNEFYPQYESQNDWIIPSTERKSPSTLLLTDRTPRSEIYSMKAA
ncbi:protocadherin 18-like isoform X1 [Octopus sinensis]|uniref:Protocadherin 18-like isoform X1 n=1 Tax=Octopus sinensis TaxID=2607531 RepID=A0A7E6EI89_9MOLL|nr:protocadherin 18-like isoform X1 [Octopus sinensis]